jgi:hypothetical protein
VPGLDQRLEFPDLTVEFLEVFHQALYQHAKGSGQLVGSIFDERWHPLGNMRDPLRDNQPELTEKTAYLLACAVRARTKPCRTRCSESTDCCSMFLTGTKRIFGRATASQIASAASFLFVFTYGLTNCGAISRSVCPMAWRLRAQ